MLKWGMLVLAGALIAGCTSASGTFPGYSRYHGVHIDLFFLEWGAPVESKQRPHGWKEYLWYSGRNSAYKPHHTDTELIANTAWWRGYRIRGFNPRLECGVRIIVAPDRTIQELLVHESSVGWWQVPRCREVFGPAVR